MKILSAVVLFGISTCLTGCAAKPTHDKLIGTWLEDDPWLMKEGVRVSGQLISNSFWEFREDGSWYRVHRFSKPEREHYIIMRGTWKREEEKVYIQEEWYNNVGIRGNVRPISKPSSNSLTMTIVNLTDSNLWLKDQFSVRFTKGDYPEGVDAAVLENLSDIPTL